MRQSRDSDADVSLPKKIVRPVGFCLRRFGMRWYSLAKLNLASQKKRLTPNNDKGLATS